MQYSLSSVGARGGSDAGRARTAKARETWRLRFEQQVDPRGVLNPTERAARAAEARRQWMRLLALRSTQVRQAERRAALARQTQARQYEQQNRCPHTWPDEITQLAECLDCGLAYLNWSDS